MAAGGQSVGLANNHQAAVEVEAEELAYHIGSLGVGDDFSLRVAQNSLLYGGSVVGLQVVDDYVVELAAGKGCGYVVHKLRHHGEVGAVEQHRLLVKQHIAVVRNSTRDGIDVLEQGETAVARTHINQVVGNFSYVMHCDKVLILCMVCCLLASLYLLSKQIANIRKNLKVQKFIFYYQPKTPMGTSLATG